MKKNNERPKTAGNELEENAIRNSTEINSSNNNSTERNKIMRYKVSEALKDEEKTRQYHEAEREYSRQSSFNRLKNY